MEEADKHRVWPVSQAGKTEDNGVILVKNVMFSGRKARV